MQDRNISVIAKSPPLREVSSRFIGSVCNFEVLSKIILAERLHPSPLRGTPLKGRGSEVRSESDSSEVRSGHQPPLALTACPLLKKEGSNNSPLLRGVDSPEAKTGCVKSPPSRPARHRSGGEVSSRFIGRGCDFEVLSTIILAERLHPSPFRGTPLKGRGSEMPLVPDSSEVRSGQALTRTFNTIITDNIY